jgi:GTPase SAR1 family protein
MIVNEQGRVTHLTILLLGAANSGKSALIDRFLSPTKPLGDYDPTIMKSFTFQQMIELNRLQSTKQEKISFDSQKIVLNLVEVGGLHPILLDEAIQEADGFMLVYSVGSKDSFTYAYDLFQRVKKVKFTGTFGTIPIMIVGSKIDLASESAIKNRIPNSFERQVTFDMGQELAHLMQIKFMETTCMAPTSVGLCFRTLLNQCQQYAFEECFPNGKIHSSPRAFDKFKDLFKMGQKKEKKVGLKRHVSMADLKSSKTVNTNVNQLESVRVWLPDEILRPPSQGSLRSQLDLAYQIQTNPGATTLQVFHH